MDVYNILLIGEIIEFLERAPSFELNVKGPNLIYENYERLVNRFKTAGIFDSTSHNMDLLNKILEPYGDDEQLKAKDKTSYRDNIKMVQSLVRNECLLLKVFPPVKECTLDKKCLMNLMDIVHSSFFEKAVWDDLSDIAQNDFSDASKCLLLGAATPAAMSCVRAGEAAVRNYYHKKTGKDPSGRSWGPLTSELKKTPGCNNDLITNLDYIRKTKRNITQHPDKIFNQREAESVFMQLISTVHELYYDTV